MPLKNINENCVFSNLTTSKFESLYTGPHLIHESEHARVFDPCKFQHLKKISKQNLLLPFSIYL